ncbi:MAG: peptidase P60 [Rhizobiales bacterium]|nr:peptidase P60 [Hyphomicrobiales bacterium]
MTQAEMIVAAARGWIGTPYRHQASERGVGSDCLGLVRGVYREVMGREPELPPAYSADWAERDGAGEQMADAARRHLIARRLGRERPGDVLLFRLRPAAPAKHAAILSDATRMIHAYSGHAVVETALTPWWQRRLVFVFSFPESD